MSLGMVSECVNSYQQVYVQESRQFLIGLAVFFHLLARKNIKYPLCSLAIFK